MSMVKKQKRDNKKRNIILAAISILLLIVVGLVLFFSGTLNTLNVLLNSQSIKNEQRNARVASEANFDLQQSKKIQTLYEAGVINNPTPTYSAKIDSCFFASEIKNKFNTVNWNQKCSLRYVDFMETSLTREEILYKLTLNSNVASLFGEPYPYNLGKNEKCDPIYRVSYSPSLHFQDWSRGNNLSCQVYNPASGSTGYSGKSKVNLIRSYDIKDISTDKSYLFISKDNDYFSKSLGCGSKGLFGCSKPISEPITDF